MLPLMVILAAVIDDTPYIADTLILLRYDTLLRERYVTALR